MVLLSLIGVPGGCGDDAKHRRTIHLLLSILGFLYLVSSLSHQLFYCESFSVFMVLSPATS